MAAAAKVRMRRELGTWLGWIKNSYGQLIDMLENPIGTRREEPAFNVDQTENAIRSLKALEQEMAEARNNLSNVAEMLDVMKKDADYKGVVVSSWPKNVFADRMTYLGTVLVAAGTGTYAFLGVPTEIGAVLLPPAILWISGFVLLVWGLMGVRRREALKWSYFTEEFDVSES